MPNPENEVELSKRSWLAIILIVFAVTCLPAVVGSEESARRRQAPAHGPTSSKNLISPAELAKRVADNGG